MSKHKSKHSIEWAIIGKSKAKTKQKTYAGDIDKTTSGTTYGETHGIMIGPVSSNLISEIILCNIDCNLSDKYKYTRHIDDYRCYVKSVEEGERFLAELRKNLLFYDLSLNEKKTKIVSIKEYNNDDLSLRVHQLDYIINEVSNVYLKVKYNQLLVYFDALDKLYCEIGNNASVYLFAFKILNEHTFSDNASKFIIEKAMKLAYNNPYLLSNLQYCIFDKYGTTPDLVDFCKNIYIDGIEEMNYEKAIYALYFSIVYNACFKLDNEEDFFNNAEANDDCLLKLLSYLYCKKFSNNKYEKEFVKLANSLNNKDDLNRNWIFVYEVLDESKLSGDWANMKKARISFLDLVV